MNNTSYPRVYHANLLMRTLVIVPCLGLANGGIFFLAFCLEEYFTTNLGKTTPTGLAVVVLILGAWIIFFGISGIAGFWLGRLVLHEGRASMPRLFIFPWGFLPLKEMPLIRVSRWGIGNMIDPSMSVAAAVSAPDGGVGGALVGLAMSSPYALAFEVDDEKRRGRKKVMRIALGAYSARDAQEIYGYFAENLGEPVQLKLHMFWGLQFPKDRWE